MQLNYCFKLKGVEWKLRLPAGVRCRQSHSTNDVWPELAPSGIHGRRAGCYLLRRLKKSGIRIGKVSAAAGVWTHAQCGVCPKWWTYCWRLCRDDFVQGFPRNRSTIACVPDRMVHLGNGRTNSWDDRLRGYQHEWCPSVLALSVSWCDIIARMHVWCLQFAQHISE